MRQHLDFAWCRREVAAGDGEVLTVVHPPPLSLGDGGCSPSTSLRSPSIFLTLQLSITRVIASSTWTRMAEVPQPAVLQNEDHSKIKETLVQDLDDLLERYLDLLDKYQSLQQALSRHLSSV